jgi:outer membrane usher protein
MLNFSVGKTQAVVTEQSGIGDSSISIQRSPDEKYGLQYSADYTPTQTRALNASAGYRSPYGDIAVDYSDNSSAALNEAVRVNGGVALIGGGIYPTRPVLGSFALVDVPNVPDVKVYAENNYVGKTNSKGKLLVPDLLPNYGNSIRVDDRDVPVNTSIQVTTERVAPAEQAGSVIVFAAHELHALGGSVVVNVHGKSVVPSYGELTILNGDTTIADSILGGAGEFYLESVPAGAYKARVVFAGGDCTFDFKAPDETGMLVKLGTLGCAMP